MKKILSLAALALMTSMMFVACGSDDETTNEPTPAPVPAPDSGTTPDTPTPTPAPAPVNPLLGTWNKVNDADRTIITELVISAEDIIDYSATNTTINSTIPDGTPTFTWVEKNDPNSGGGVLGFATKRTGYISLPPAVPVTDAAGKTTNVIPSSGQITLWPQTEMTSMDGSNWTAVPKAQMLNRIDYNYQKIGDVLVFTAGNSQTHTYILNKGVPTTPVAVSEFVKTWTLPNDMDPTYVEKTTVELVLMSDTYTDFAPVQDPTNPTIPAGSPSFTKTTTIDARAFDPTAQLNCTKQIGYYTLNNAPVDMTATVPAIGRITFWIQRQMTSTDGSTWTETPIAEIPVKMEEYTYTISGNVMKLTRGDQTTQTYYNIPVTVQ